MKKTELLRKLSQCHLDMRHIDWLIMPKNVDLAAIDGVLELIPTQYAVLFAKIMTLCRMTSSVPFNVLANETNANNSDARIQLIIMIDELSELFPIILDVEPETPYINCDPNFLAYIMRDKVVPKGEKEYKDLAEMTSLFEAVFQKYKKGIISAEYFKRLLFENVDIENEPGISFWLQFFTIEERFLYFYLIYLQSLRKQQNGVNLNEMTDYLEVLGVYGVELGVEFEKLVTIKESEDRDVIFYLKNITQVPEPQLNVQYLDSAIRVLKSKLFELPGIEFRKVAIAPNSYLRSNIIRILHEHTCENLLLNVAKIELMPQNERKGFLNSLFVEAENFIESNDDFFRRFILLTGWDLAKKSSNSIEKDHLNGFLDTLMTFNKKNLTLIVFTNELDIWRWDLAVHADEDSIENILDASSKRIEKLKKIKHMK